MPDTIDILIRSLFDAKGTQQAQQALAALQAAGKSTSAAGGGAAKPIADAGAAATKAERDILRYASSLAAAQKAQGDLSGAAQTWKAALGQMTPNTIEANRATVALAQAQTALQKELSGTASYASQVGQSVSASLTSIIGPAAAAAAAIKSIQVGVDLAQVGAQAEQTRIRFDQLAAQAGTTGDAMLAALRKSSGGTIGDTALQLDAMKASLLGVAQNADQLGPLLAIARDRAQQMGISVEFAFESLVTGLGRGSRLILDNIGVIVKAGEVNAAYAASVGKTVDQLTEQEQKQALINEVVRQGNETIAKTGGAVESAASSQQRLAASFTNIKAAVGGALADMSVGFVEGLSEVINATHGTSEELANGAVAVTNFSRSLMGLPQVSQATAAAIRDSTAAAAESASGYNNATAAYYGAAAANQQVAASSANATDIEQIRINVLNAAAAGSAAAGSAALGYADALAMNTVQANAAAQAAQIKANADQVAAVNAETHRVAQEALAKQAMAAAQGLLAAGSAGASTAAMLASSSSQVDVLTAAYYRLLAAQRAAGAGATQQQAADFRSMEVFGQTSAQRTAAIDKERQADAARSQQIIQTGSAAQKTAELQRIYNDAVRQSGPASAAAIQAQTALLSAQEKGARAGGAARASAAQAGSDRLASIEQSTGNKLEDIDRSTQEKLIAIDEKAAEARAAAARRLTEMLATSAADRRAQDEADDLELIGVKDKKQAQALNDRERAQAASRKREAAAAKEAQDLVAAGEAEAAGKVYEIRETQISKQQDLDEKYAERQRELSGNTDALAALQQQYDEGTRAIQEAADKRVGFELAAAAQARQAVEDEKAAVVAAAEDQKNQVIGKAQQSAEGVKKASGEARAKAVSDLQAIGAAVTAIPTSKTITITTVQQTVGGSPTARATGGDTNVGRATLVGEQGPELVVFDTPGRVYSASATRAMGGIPRMATGGTIDAGGGYTTPIAGGGGKSGGGGGKSAAGGGPAPANMEAATKALNQQIAYYKAVAELSHLAASLLPTLDTAVIQRIADDSKRIGAVVGSVLVPISKDNMKMLDDYDKAVEGSTSILLNAQNARKELANPQPPIDPAYIQSLAADTRTIGAAIGGLLTPIAQTSLMELEDYDKAVGGSASILKSVQDVRKDLAAPQPPLDPVMLYHMAIDAQRATGVIKSLLIPYTEEQTDQMDRYEKAVSSSAGVFKSVSEFSSKLFTDYQSPTDAQIAVFARDAERVTRAMANAAVTFDTKGLEASKLYNEAVGGTFANIKDGLLAAQAISSGDFTLDAGKLAQFTQSSKQMIDATRGLATQAAAIPASDIAALSAITAATTAQFESMIKMAAVPWGDLGTASASYAASGGALGKGGTTVNNYNTFSLPQGTTQQLAQEVIKILNAQTGARR